MSSLQNRGAPSPDTGHERREQTRILTFRTAKLIWAGQDEPLDCAVLDFSSGGVRVLVPDHAVVPERLEIAIEHPAHFRRACSVQWRSGAKLGLRYAD